MNDTDQPATKRDLQDLEQKFERRFTDFEKDLKNFIVEREVSSIRWFIGVFGALQVTYFFGTLALVYFLISHIQK